MLFSRSQKHSCSFASVLTLTSSRAYKPPHQASLAYLVVLLSLLMFKDRYCCGSPSLRELSPTLSFILGYPAFPPPSIPTHSSDFLTRYLPKTLIFSFPIGLAYYKLRAKSAHLSSDSVPGDLASWTLFG